MSWSTIYNSLLQHLPQVEGPQQKKLDFGVKIKWTLIVLVLYFILRHIPLYGLGQAALQQFQSLSVILGAEFGSLVSLGIGPIVTASIFLQLLNGSGLLKFDLHTQEGKQKFQGTSKLLAYVFLVFESIIYVFMGGLAPDPALVGTSLYLTMEIVLIAQLILGGFIVILLDDLLSKWGIGSGISLFIAAGVSESLFIQLFSIFKIPGDAAGYMVGALPRMLQALPAGDVVIVAGALAGILATVFVFGLVVFVQSMKVEIPLSFGRVAGFGIRWPLNFLYTSVMPVILIAALFANIQLGAVLLENKFGIPAQSVAQWVTAPQLVSQIVAQQSFAIGLFPYVQSLIYLLIMMGGACLFSWFWMQTSGMDSSGQAKQIMASGLHIPGFRKDPRIIVHVLNRYVVPLTVMGGLTIGFLAAIADISGALTTGTGLLLAVMIVFKIYEDIAKQHLTDLDPSMRKFMGGR